jgi:hypothetical protein
MAENLPTKAEPYEVMSASREDQDFALETLRGSRITDLEKITVPAAASPFWNVPTLTGPEAKKTIQGIILDWRDTRAYWKLGIEEGGAGQPPDCVSEDTEIGYGERWDNDPEQIGPHKCSACPLSQFGSDENERAQACSHRLNLLLVMPHSLIPVVVQIPPTGLKEVRGYFRRLVSQKTDGQYKRPYMVETELSLETAKSAAGQSYSRPKARPLRALSADEIKTMAHLKEKLKEVFSKTRLEESPKSSSSSPD